MSAVAGRILLISKGDYDANTVYNTLDWVRHNSAAWVCKADNTQNEPPSTSSTKWALMAADSAYSSLGDLNDVSISAEAAGQFLGCVIDTSVTPPVITWENLSAATTYSSTGTAPISGTGVADALTDYYTKAEIPLPDILKYGGTKTGTQLVDMSMLVAANAGYVYMASSAYVSTIAYLQGEGHYVPTGSLVAVVPIGSTGQYYSFCIISEPQDEWNTYQNAVEEIIENSTTGWRTVTFHNVQPTDVVQVWADTVDGRVVTYKNPTYIGNYREYSISANVTALPTKFYLRKIR